MCVCVSFKIIRVSPVHRLLRVSSWLDGSCDFQMFPTHVRPFKSRVDVREFSTVRNKTFVAGNAAAATVLEAQLVHKQQLKQKAALAAKSAREVGKSTGTFQQNFENCNDLLENGSRLLHKVQVCF